MNRPLAGTRVVEICNVASGPFCGMLLADMGADVVKVEHPAGGDSMRAWPPISDGYSENFASVNRNKRSVRIDLKSPEGKRAARELIASADVLVENNRPGVMERLGLDFATVRQDNPRIIYCSISAFGQEGPRRSQAGFDLTVQAMSGIMSVTGEADGNPVKCGVPVSDFATGLYAAFGIASCLPEARRTGLGTHIDASMLGSSLAIAALQTSQYFGTQVDPVKAGSAHPRNAPYQAFATADGSIAMAAGNNSLWRAVCAAVDRPDLAADPRFETNVLRAQNQQILADILEACFADKTTVELLDLFEAHGVPCAPINSYSEALADPQVQHMGWVQEIELPNGISTSTFGLPLRMDSETYGVLRNPPELGQHDGDLPSPWAPAEPWTAADDLSAHAGAGHV